MNNTAIGARVGGWLLLASFSAPNAPAADPPPPPLRSEVERVLSAVPRAPRPAGDLRPLQIVLLADRKDHGPGEHDYPRWQSRWALLSGGAAASAEKAANLAGPDLPDAALAQGAEQVRVLTAQQWPEPRPWAEADVVVAFCYLSWTAPRLGQVRRYLDRGGGLVLIHSATWTKPEPSAEVAELTGVGGFERWRHGPLNLKILPGDHPICHGLPAAISWDDESYWPPTPALNTERVRVLAGSQEQADSGGGATALQPMFWTYQRGPGRVFGCVPGHKSSTFDDPYFRLLLLRGLAWAAGEDPYRFDGLVLRSAAVRPG
jgi:type 1 glutamine amidotransferase